MTRNKRFGFDEDCEVYCMSLITAAQEAKDAADAAANAAVERAEAVACIRVKLMHFFEYFEGFNLLGYVNVKDAAEQIIHSLSKIGEVPIDLINEAAQDMLETTESVDRENILKALEAMTGDEYI